MGIAGAAAATAIVAITPALGAGAALSVAVTILASGATGGWINARNGENPIDGFSGGVLNASIVVLSAACVPVSLLVSLDMQISVIITVNAQAAYLGTVLTETARGKSDEEIEKDAAVSMMGQLYFSGIWGSVIGAVLGTYNPIAVMLSVIYGAAGSIVSDALIPLLVKGQDTETNDIGCGGVEG